MLTAAITSATTVAAGKRWTDARDAQKTHAFGRWSTKSGLQTPDFVWKGGADPPFRISACKCTDAVVLALRPQSDDMPDVPTRFRDEIWSVNRFRCLREGNH